MGFFTVAEFEEYFDPTLISTTLYQVSCTPGCYLNVTCKFNMWTGASDCPTDVAWVPGQGIVGTNPALASFASVPPPPPPPSGDGGGGN